MVRISEQHDGESARSRRHRQFHHTGANRVGNSRSHSHSADDGGRTRTRRPRWSVQSIQSLQRRHRGRNSLSPQGIRQPYLPRHYRCLHGDAGVRADNIADKFNLDGGFRFSEITYRGNDTVGFVFALQQNPKCRGSDLRSEQLAIRRDHAAV